ncbi:hypothetical protein BU9_CDS0046 [Klebsiella phage Kpn BU9]|nr:hypothetical protein BU9_CDS0046 [Klebsiella phage Kpn BU9]
MWGDHDIQPESLFTDSNHINSVLVVGVLGSAIDPFFI